MASNGVQEAFGKPGFGQLCSSNVYSDPEEGRSALDYVRRNSAAVVNDPPAQRESSDPTLLYVG